MSSSTKTNSSDTRRLISEAEADLNRLLSSERDAMRLGSLKRARHNLDEAKKSLQGNHAMADLLAARALKIIEDFLPADHLERKRLYLLEGMKRFNSAGWKTDAAELETRLGRLPAAKTSESPEQESRVPAPKQVEMPSPSVKAATSAGGESRFAGLLKSGTVGDWLTSIEVADERGEVELRDALTRAAKDYSTPGYRSFLIACFETTKDRSKLLYLVEGADKPTKRLVELLCDFRDKGEIECFISDSPLIYATKLLETLAGLKEEEGPKRGRWEFRLSTGKTVAVVSEAKKERGTGRVESYIFKLEPAQVVSR